MNQERQRGSELKAKWQQIADKTESNWDRNFWELMATKAPLPNHEAHGLSHLILSDLWIPTRMLIDSLERSGVDLLQWKSEVDTIKNELAKRDALSDMFNADWKS